MKRTEIARKTPMKRAPMTLPSEPKPAPGPRKRKCIICRDPFEPRNMQHKACGPSCAIEHAAIVAAKQKAKAQRQERAADKVKRDGMKTYPQLIRETQKAFNAAIRLRDQLAGYPCISSGKPLDWSGNATDAGHFRSIGSAPQLRFNEDNCHAQSKMENRFLAGNAIDYRINLITRIGLARVEVLESNNTPRKWTHDELRELKAHYQRKVRDMRKENAY